MVYAHTLCKTRLVFTIKQAAKPLFQSSGSRVKLIFKAKKKNGFEPLWPNLVNIFLNFKRNICTPKSNWVCERKKCNSVLAGKLTAVFGWRHKRVKTEHANVRFSILTQWINSSRLVSLFFVSNNIFRL